MNHYQLFLRTSVVLFLIEHGTSQLMPGPFPFPAPGPMPIPFPMSGPAPVPPLPMPFPMLPQQKLPIVVMPYYSKAADKIKKHQKKKRRPRIRYVSEESCSSESSSSDSSSDFDFRAKNHRPKVNRRKKRPVLTPVVSYVTKDGYVVYQKKIKKDRAKDWLEMSRTGDVMEDSQEEKSGESVKELKRRLRFKKKNNHDP